MARRFPDEQTALAAYETTRDLLLTDDLEASAFRLTLDAVSYVTVLGERLLAAEEANRIDEALRLGDEAELPGPVVAELRRRRGSFKTTGFEFLERRTRNG